MSRPSSHQKDVALVDVLDRLLQKGVVARGEVAIRLADIDLIYLELQLLVTSISKIATLRGASGATEVEEILSKKDREVMEKLEEEIKRAEQAIPRIIEGESEEIEKGLARLVLSLVELIRRLMEREALRQVKMKHLSKAKTQKLGLALEALAKKMQLIQKTFGLSDKDLNLDLGPIGNLLE